MAAGTSALLVLIGGGAAGVVLLIRDEPPSPETVTALGQADPVVPPLDSVPDGVTGGPDGITGGIGGATSVPVVPGVGAATGGPGITGGLTGGVATMPPGSVVGPGPGGSLPRISGQVGRTATGDPRRPANAKPVPALPGKAPAKPPAKAPVKAPGNPVKPGQATSPQQPTAAAPVLTTRSETETRAVPFQTRTIRDPWLPRGAKQTQTEGVPGEETLRYLVTLTDGKPTARRLVDTTVTREPRHRVVIVGTGRFGGFGSGPDGRPHGGWYDGGRLRECRPLAVCLKLGRSATCPEDAVPAETKEPVDATREEDANAMDAALLGAEDLAGVELPAC